MYIIIFGLFTLPEQVKRLSG